MRNDKEFNFNDRTNETVKQWLTTLNARREQRVRLYYGDTETGKSWEDEYDIIGTIGKSTGIKPIPLIVNNVRSLGGSGLLDHCIVAIQDVETKRFLYKHESFTVGEWTVTESKEQGYTYSVCHDDSIYANCKSQRQAENLCKFMKGERMCK